MTPQIYPLQTSNNCVAYAYWVAMQEALFRVDPFRKLDFTPADVERHTGAPASPWLTGKHLESSAAFAGFIFWAKELPGKVTVWATWQNGYGHVLVRFDGTDGYDPALGVRGAISMSMTGTPTSVACLYAEHLPYSKWYYRFAFVRKVLELLS